MEVFPYLDVILLSLNEEMNKIKNSNPNNKLVFKGGLIRKMSFQQNLTIRIWIHGDTNTGISGVEKNGCLCFS